MKFSILLVSFLATGCGAACPIISLAADACPVVVEFIGEDGQKHSVQLPKESLQEPVAAAAMKAGVAGPKGAPSAAPAPSAEAPAATPVVPAAAPAAPATPAVPASAPAK